VDEKGYVKLYRKLLTNPVICKDGDYLSVWIYLLLKATHTEYPDMFKGQKIILQPGQLITGRKKIAEKLSISESKVTRIINKFIFEQQIEQQTSNENRLITILNWKEYQGSEQQTEQPVNNHRTTSEQPVNTNKNVKNVKNNNKENPAGYQKKFLEGSFELKCVEYLIKSIRSDMPDAKLPTDDKDIDKWCDYIEKMVRLDKRTTENIFKTLVFARTDSFWKSNIRSASKFREKYETLFSQMQNRKQPQQPKPQGNPTNRFNQFPQRQYTPERMQEIEKKLLNKSL
jgi:DNA-binding MarR family transcriptional regulator